MIDEQARGVPAVLNATTSPAKLGQVTLEARRSVCLSGSKFDFEPALPKSAILGLLSGIPLSTGVNV